MHSKRDLLYAVQEVQVLRNWGHWQALGSRQVWSRAWMTFEEGSMQWYKRSASAGGFNFFKEQQT